MIKNKKGFSLVELIVVVAILAVLSAILIPHFIASSTDSQKKVDKSAIDNLTTTIQVAAQKSDIYKEGKKLADMSDDNRITIKYVVDDNDMLAYDCVLIDNREVTDENKTKADSFMEKVKNHIGGVIEPIELKSKFYKSKEYMIVLFFDPEVSFSVKAEVQMQDADS